MTRRLPPPRTFLAGLALAAVLVLVGGLAAAQETLRIDDRAAAREHVERLVGLLERLRGQIDRTRFDATELAFELAFEDAETIVAWVRDEIAYEPYLGLLRGPDATLMARGGNALDQAVLLSTLLTDAGYEVRIVRGRLPEDEARALLARAALPRPEAPPIGDVDAMADTLDELARLTGEDAETLRTALLATEEVESLADPELIDEVRSTAEGLERALADAGIDLNAWVDDGLIDTASDYFWSEYRLSPADEWTPAHATGHVPAQLPEAQEILEGTVPQELLHRVRIEVELEQKLGDRLERHALMEPWERPTANLTGTVISYANAPDGFEPDSVDAFAVDAVAEGTDFFAPMFMGSLADGGMYFDTDGNLVDPLAATNQAAGVFRNVGGAFEGAAGGLSNLGSDEPAAADPDDLRTLTGQWLVITTIAPDGTETTHRRTIVDRIAAADREGAAPIPADELDVALALLRQHRIMISTGAVPLGYLLDRALERLIETAPFLELVLQAVAEPDEDLALDTDRFAEPSGLDALIAFDLFERELASIDAGPGYRPEPAIVALSESLEGTREDAVLVRSIDIVANPRRVLSADDGEPRPLAALLRGVWETVAERELAASTEGVVALAAADAAAPPYRVLAPGGAPAVEDLGLPAEATAQIRSDLDRGFVVLLSDGPERPEEPAWWRVDPRTGVTLGVTHDGRGQAATEYAIQVSDTALTIMFSIKGLADCQQVESDTARLCCLLQAHLSNVAGFGLGGIIGKAFSSSDALMFTIVTGVTGYNFGEKMGLTCEEFA